MGMPRNTLNFRINSSPNYALANVSVESHSKQTKLFAIAFNELQTTIHRRDSEINTLERFCSKEKFEELNEKDLWRLSIGTRIPLYELIQAQDFYKNYLKKLKN